MVMRKLSVYNLGCFMALMVLAVKRTQFTVSLITSLHKKDNFRTANVFVAVMVNLFTASLVHTAKGCFTLVVRYFNFILTWQYSANQSRGGFYKVCFFPFQSIVSRVESAESCQ